MERSNWFVYLALPLLIAGLSACREGTPYAAVHEGAPARNPVSTVSLEDLPGESIYQVGSTWTDQEGRTVSLSDFDGKPVVVSMVFTRCGYACPTTVRDMKRIETELKNSGQDDIHFVLVTFDSENDTPDVLRSFAITHELDPGRWTLLNGRSVDVRLLAAVLGVRYKRESSGFYSHSNLISILDRDGIVVHRQEGLGASPVQSVATLKALIAGS